MIDKSKEVVIVAAVRTPIGSYKGSLKNIKADQLGSIVIKEVINRYGSIGSHIYSLSQGKDLRRVVPQRQIKSISHETTFENDISDKEVLEKKLWSLCEKVSKRSKEKGLGGQTITLKLKI